MSTYMSPRLPLLANREEHIFSHLKVNTYDGLVEVCLFLSTQYTAGILIQVNPSCMSESFFETVQCYFFKTTFMSIVTLLQDLITLSHILKSFLFPFLYFILKPLLKSCQSLGGTHLLLMMDPINVHSILTTLEVHELCAEKKSYHSIHLVAI